jgi:hypothetical protein
MYLKNGLAIGVLLASVGSLPAQEMVENPEYTSWSKFPKGTSLRMKSIRVAGKLTSEVIVTDTLIEIGPDKLVLETTSLEKNKAKDFKSEPAKREVLKTIALPKGLKKEDFAAGKPPGTTAEGSETLKIADLEIKTVWYKYGAELDKTKIEAKRWVSSQVPGNIVRNEITTTGAFADTLTLEVIEIKKP